MQRRQSRRGRSEAHRADRYRLYEASVQDVDYDCDLVERMFRRRYGRTPHVLREDFSGSSAMACAWTERHPENVAYGIDLDPAPLAWARQHHVAHLSDHEAQRVSLLRGDVRDVETGLADVIVAFNFSYFVFKQRGELLGYFEKTPQPAAAPGALRARSLRRRGLAPRAHRDARSRRLLLRLGSGGLRPDQLPRAKPHPLPLPRRQPDRARLHVRLAPLDPARAARSPPRRRLLARAALLGAHRPRDQRGHRLLLPGPPRQRRSGVGRLSGGLPLASEARSEAEPSEVVQWPPKW